MHTIGFSLVLESAFIKVGRHQVELVHIPSQPAPPLLLLYEKRVLVKFHAHRRWENELAPDWVTIHDLDEDEIQATLQSAISLGRMKKPIHTDSESILRGLGLFDDGHLMNAAVA